jgi:putative heme-binding domain-containing protein
MTAILSDDERFYTATQSILAQVLNPSRCISSRLWSESVCGSCFRVGDRGTPVGPDLSTIGKLRSPEELLDSLLAPSRRVEPKYAAYAVATTGGQSFTGLLVKRDEHQVVLRDSQGKEVSLAAKDVEQLRPSTVSLMPDGQLANLTAQEAADLIQYLASLR